MRFIKAFKPVIRNHLFGGAGQSKCGTRRRQFVACLFVLLLGACSLNDDLLSLITPDEEKPEDKVEFYPGGVVADEPLAAMIGRDILTDGGTAADAAAAVYFALAVTMPSSASLGGGGTCVAWNHWNGVAEAIDFLARAPQKVPAAASRPSAVPGNPRGFFALHNKYGRLRWERVLAPAETLARFGHPVSRAFANDLASVESALLAEPETRRVFSGADGRGLVKEGETIKQLDLAAVLENLRHLGTDDFYTGKTAAKLVDAFNRAGGSLNLEDLGRYAPRWRQTINVPFDFLNLHFAPPPAAAGAVEAEIWAMLTQGERYQKTSSEEQPHLFAEAILRAFADRGQWLGQDGSSAIAVPEFPSRRRIGRLMASYRPERHIPAAALDPAPVERPENPAATSFVALDGAGSAVACALTMNNRFGTGRIAPGTGILPAALPGQGGRGPLSLGPVIVVDHEYKDFYFAAAASGGVTAPTAIMNVLTEVILKKKPLSQALTAKRLHHGGFPDLVYYEQGYGEAALQALIKRGHRIAATAELGRVNAAACVSGLPIKPGTCTLKADPRGFGLAATAERYEQ